LRHILQAFGLAFFLGPSVKLEVVSYSFIGRPFAYAKRLTLLIDSPVP
jgi:hypothetical protein